ncbi:PREDICTED: HD domain-containing protein 2 [Tarenaya hassleriana]|uniref:HD domain-containing protein 2 n=1 Tax=Tarenaya hassleriana TaxID=28532 RepID=UPI00053C505C|nr:PREDICTED: HD domain-containing protein 2 [Tarenaya hassleriana]
MMRSVNRVLFCRSSSFVLLVPSLARSQLRFSFSAAGSPALPNRTIHRMAAGASHSSSSSLSGGDDGAVPRTSGNDAATHSSAAASAIDFLTLCTRLKMTKRAGWVKRNVKDAESIADHMYRMGLMALISSDIPSVDRDKCIKMAIVHDIAEAIVGDITPSDGIAKEEKSRREREALEHMCQLLGGGPRAKEIAELWAEYEENSSPEAKVVKDFDKVEMILQALEYENEQGKDLEEFFQSTAGKFQTEIGKAWALEIASRRRSKH